VARSSLVSTLLSPRSTRRSRARADIPEGLIEAAMKPKAKKRKLFNYRTPQSSTRIGTPLTGPSRGLTSVTPDENTNGPKTNDLLLHNLLAPALATVGVDDILALQCT